jgi:hypothetical protein
MVYVEGCDMTAPAYFGYAGGSTIRIQVDETVASADSGRYFFDSWEHGGPRVQTYTVPIGSKATGLLARYVFKYRLDIASDHGSPVGAGWLKAWFGAAFSVEDTVVEKIPPHDFPAAASAKAFAPSDTDSVRYLFDRWQGNGLGSYTGTDNPATVTMNGNITETALWKTQFPLVVQVSDPTLGSVAVYPPGVWQDRDSLVSIKAIPEPGCAFSGWEGSVAGPEDSVAFAMDTSKAVLARFVRTVHPPVIAIPDTSFAEDDTLKIPLLSLLQWITDPVDPVYLLTFQIEGTPEHLHASLYAAGLMVFADPGWNGDGWFALEVSDPSGGIARDTVRYEVTAVDDAPGPFDLVSPAKDFVYNDTTQSLVFKWRSSANADASNGDSIRYAFYFAEHGQSMDSVAVTLDTTYSWPHPEWIADGDYSWKVKALDKQGNFAWSGSEGGITVTGIDSRKAVPLSYGLSQNYPNPFNPSTGITYAVPKKARVRIEVYSLTGKRIRTLVDEDRVPGEYAAAWDGLDDAGRKAVSGVYFCRMTAGTFARTVKMTVLK